MKSVPESPASNNSLCEKFTEPPRQLMHIRQQNKKQLYPTVQGRLTIMTMIPNTYILLVPKEDLGNE